MSVVINTAVAGGAGTGGTGSSQAAPVTITGNNSLTHADHFNRQVKIADAGATTQTLNNDATNGAEAGDILEIDNTGAGTATVVQGTGTLLVATGYTAAVAPNTSGSFIYMGSNTWISATPSPTAATTTVTALEMTTPAAVAGGATNAKSTTFAIPAGTLGTKGQIRVSFFIAKTGAAETCATSVRVGAAGFAFSGGSVAATMSVSTSLGTFSGEAIVYANGTDQLTVLMTSTGSANPINVAPLTQTTFTHNHGTTPFEIAIGGNGGATTGTWIVTSAQALLTKPV